MARGDQVAMTMSGWCAFPSRDDHGQCASTSCTCSCHSGQAREKPTVGVRRGTQWQNTLRPWVGEVKGVGKKSVTIAGDFGTIRVQIDRFHEVWREVT